ncbi:phosphomevalonate kinase [Coemansia sp. RSA 988]|nr:phosphomevalonate kinase [Coemansia sp. RSA 988]
MTAATPAESSITLVSAPGKVLAVGGYLVLDRRHSGLVLGTDARLYAAVQTQSIELGRDTHTTALGDQDVPIIVVSPQFESAWWKYVFNTKRNTLSQIGSASQDTNSFVHIVLHTTLALVNKRDPKKLQALLAAETGSSEFRTGLRIVLAADNDFYSQREILKKMGLELTSKSLASVPAMAATGKTLKSVHKTGLGSSAAMVTSLVASILMHFGIFDNEGICAGTKQSSSKSQNLQLIHNVAQYAHCLAQGKVGSGFDVSAAVYGSHRYRRFSPSVLSAAMENNNGTTELVQMTSPDNAGWDSEVVPVQVPPGLILRLADVDAGSNTPSMVKRVLLWRDTNPQQADSLWASLDKANNRIRQLWNDLSSAHEKDCVGYNSAINQCSLHPSTRWESEAASTPSSTISVHALLAELARVTLRMRELQRELGEKAGVPIEPPKQTRLLDACMTVPGVCMAAVPGAGGYDAIFCIALSKAAGDAVERLWSSWTEMSVGPLLAKQASDGVSILDPELYPDLIAKLK